VLLKDFFPVAFRGPLEFADTGNLFVEGALAAGAEELPEGDIDEQWKPCEFAMPDLPGFGFLDATGFAAPKAAASVSMEDGVCVEGLGLTKLVDDFATVESNDTLTEQHGVPHGCNRC
jgi:hypothetical protein